MQLGMFFVNTALAIVMNNLAPNNGNLNNNILINLLNPTHLLSTMIYMLK